MNKTQNTSIPIEKAKSNFKNFLIDKNNKRIFFSAKFGMGKTYFFQKFFEENKTKYEAYHLFPVRYQMLNNENILEFLKCDIMLNLLKKNPNIFKNSKESEQKNWWKIFGKILWKDKWSSLSKISKTLSVPFLSEIFEILGHTWKETQKFFDTYDGEKNFGKSIKLKNHLTGEDYITHLIRQTNKKTEKRNILIMDDFDRVDPEHIFRILNIFSSQMDDKEENKFGFDHIIIVAALANIKNIFHHKYGTDTNFEGYFDKFFTVKPYHFTNKKAIMAKIPELLKHIKYENKELKGSIDKNGGILKQFLEKILIDAFDIDAGINLRRLYKTINHTFPEMKKKFSDEYYQGQSFLKQRCQFINTGIKLLISMFEGKKYFLEILNKITKLPLISRDKCLQLAWAMIKEIISEIEEPNWLDKYQLQLTKPYNILISSKNNGKSNLCFYETLIEYVKKSKYK